MNEIKIFESEQFGKIRTSMTESGEPLFCLSDVCKALALTNPSEVKKRLQQMGGVLLIPLPKTSMEQQLFNK